MAGFQFNVKDDIQPYAEYFDRRITIEQLVAGTPDGQGGSSPQVWAAVFKTWAHLEPWKGREAWLAQQVYPNSWERVIIRYKNMINVNTKMRLRFKGKVYNIRWVGVPVESNKVIEILCEELQAKGSMA